MSVGRRVLACSIALIATLTLQGCLFVVAGANVNDLQERIENELPWGTPVDQVIAYLESQPFPDHRLSQLTEYDPTRGEMTATLDTRETFPHGRTRVRFSFDRRGALRSVSTREVVTWF